MALKRSPTSIVVNGAYLRIKSASGGGKGAAEAAGLFADYVTVPGLGSWTMPAETGSVTETAIMDGSIAAPQFKGVGTITGAMPALGAHPSHQFLEQRSIDQQDIQIAIVKPASAGAQLAVPSADDIVIKAAANGRSQVDVVSAASRARIKQSVLWGHIVAFGKAAGAAGLAVDSRELLAYNAAAAGAIPAGGSAFHAVVAVEDDGSKFWIAPGLAAEEKPIVGAFVCFRNPGKRWEDLLVKVNQFDQGDFQSGSNVGSNFTFTPSTTVQAAIVEHRVEGKGAGQINYEV